MVFPELNLLERVQDSTAKSKFHCLWLVSVVEGFRAMWSVCMPMSCLSPVRKQAHLSIILLKWEDLKTEGFRWKHTTGGRGAVYCEQKQGLIGRVAHREKHISGLSSSQSLWIIYKQYSQFLENILTPVWVKEKYD